MPKFMGFAKNARDEPVAQIEGAGRTFAFEPQADGSIQKVEKTTQELTESAMQHRFGLSFKDLPREYPPEGIDLAPLIAAAQTAPAAPGVRMTHGQSM